MSGNPLEKLSHYVLKSKRQIVLRLTFRNPDQLEILAPKINKVVTDAINDFMKVIAQ